MVSQSLMQSQCACPSAGRAHWRVGTQAGDHYASGAIVLAQSLRKHKVEAGGCRYMPVGAGWGCGDWQLMAQSPLMVQWPDTRCRSCSYGDAGCHAQNPFAAPPVLRQSRVCRLAFNQSTQGRFYESAVASTRISAPQPMLVARNPGAAAGWCLTQPASPLAAIGETIRPYVRLAR